MQPKPDERFGEADPGTWQGPPPGSASSGETTLNEPQPGSIGISTPTPGPSDDSHESEDSEDSTPKPGVDPSAEWDLLPPPLIAEGREVFGKYRLVKKIGEGGMGEVWLVDDLELDRKCALKLVKPEIAHNEKGWKRFRREARLMAKLDHPNAVAVHGFKRAHSMGYIEMEFVRGKSLDKYLNERGEEPIPLDRIVTILDQLCAVLHEAHGHIDEKSGKPTPIIHRDLKPSNIMLVDRKPPGQDLKVLDFGIAKMLEEEGGPDATLTGAGDFLGTPAYMSPEQIRGGWGKDAQREVDGRSDLYSVGVLLYQLITGKLPFRARDPRALMAANLAEQPRPMKEANPKVNVPPAVERVVMQCLEKDPAKRPQSAQELARSFRAAAGRSHSRRSLWIAVGAACLAIGTMAGSLPSREAELAVSPPASLHPLAFPRTRSGGATHTPGAHGLQGRRSRRTRRELGRARADRTHRGRRDLQPPPTWNLPACGVRARIARLVRPGGGLAAGHRPQARQRPIHSNSGWNLPARRPSAERGP